MAFKAWERCPYRSMEITSQRLYLPDDDGDKVHGWIVAQCTPRAWFNFPGGANLFFRWDDRLVLELPDCLFKSKNGPIRASMRERLPRMPVFLEFYARYGMTIVWHTWERPLPELVAQIMGTEEDLRDPARGIIGID